MSAMTATADQLAAQPQSPTQRQAQITKPIKITIFRWGGSWGPFKVKIPCGECALTQDIVRDTIENELDGIPVEVETIDWLSNWWKAARYGGWHAPIVMVEGKIISQGESLNRGILAQAVVGHHVERTGMEGHHIFGKDRCGHCTRAKEMLDAAGIEYTYHDVVKNPRAVFEMVPRAKQHIGHRTPVTTPQIWLDGAYVGGADQLEEKLGQ